MGGSFNGPKNYKQCLPMKCEFWVFFVSEILPSQSFRQFWEQYAVPEIPDKVHDDVLRTIRTQLPFHLKIKRFET